MAVFHIRDVVRNSAGCRCCLHHLVTWHIEELRCAVDEPGNQPRTCDTVNLWTFTGNPFHGESPVLEVIGPLAAVPASVQKLPGQAQQSTADNDGNNTKLEPEDGYRIHHPDK